MLFKTGDFFEVSGKIKYKVIYADEEIFIACPVLEGGWNPTKKEYDKFECLDDATVYKNQGSIEEKYWVKKIDAFECVNKEPREEL